MKLFRTNAANVLLVCAFALVACASPVTDLPPDPIDVPSDWIELSAGQSFTMWAPPGTTYEQLQGIDSFVGRFHNPAFTTQFDYGSYGHSAGGVPRALVLERPRIDRVNSVIYVERNVGSIAEIESCGTLVGLLTDFVQQQPVEFFHGDRIERPPVTLDMFSCTMDEKEVPMIARAYKTIRFHRNSQR